MPSRRSSSVTVTSKATVSFPSLATNHPGMSSLKISTSDASMMASAPSRFSVYLPFFSSSAMASCDISATAAATAFICFPNLGPSFLKSHFTFFISTPAAPSTNLTSFTFTSFMINAFTASMWAFCSSSTTGIMIHCNGWRTLIFTFRRSANTMEVTSCAICIRASNALSIISSLYSGNLARWMETTVSRPVAEIRSPYKRSA